MRVAASAWETGHQLKTESALFPGTRPVNRKYVIPLLAALTL